MYDTRHKKGLESTKVSVKDIQHPYKMYIQHPYSNTNNKLTEMTFFDQYYCVDGFRYHAIGIHTINRACRTAQNNCNSAVEQRYQYGIDQS